MAKKREARKTRSGEPVEAGLLTTLKAVGDWLADANVKFAVIGGVAASLHGRPRVTKDVVLVAIVAEDAWQHLLQRASRYGLEPRIGDALSFARTTRVLLLRHVPTQIEVDLSFGVLPFEIELVKRARRKRVRKVTFPLAEDHVAELDTILRRMQPKSSRNAKILLRGARRPR